jgi:hypothetical protein
MPSRVFYSVLDSVNFNPLRPRVDRDQVRISAAGSLMLGILIGNISPVLTDAQVFDNRLIIDTVAAFDRDSSAFLGLIREGRLNLGLLRMPNLAIESNRQIKLTDSFAAALNRPNFVFSAWPDLEEPSIRQAVASVIIADADPSREFDNPEGCGSFEVS